MAFDEERLLNPVWSALTGPQRGFALAGSSWLRYQPEVLPFAAVAAPETAIVTDGLLEHGPVYFCDVLPVIQGDEVSVAHFAVAQMVYRGDPTSAEPWEGELELSMQQAGEMLALTDAAFPGLFRIATPRLGRYLGIRHHGRLVAMAGERFRFAGLREISAVCTLPGYTGRGFAAHLITRLLDDLGELPFLHVSESNTRAIQLYERLGFVRARTITVIKVDRADSPAPRDAHAAHG